MNRREFLLSLLSVPFGWKALFRKEVKKETEEDDSLSEWADGKLHHWAICHGDTARKYYVDGVLVKEEMLDPLRDGWVTCEDWVWSEEEGIGVLADVDEDKWARCMEIMIEDAMQEEEESFQYVQGIPLEPEIPGTFAGLDKVINTGWEEKCEDPECPECNGGLLLPDWVADELKSGKTYREWVVDIPLDDIPDGWMRWAPIDAPSWDLPLCEAKPEIRMVQCEASAGTRVDGMDTVNGPISNLRDWGKESQFVYTNPSYGVSGQRMWAEDICRILTEIIERDVPGMLLEGQMDIDWDPPYAYIRYPCGPWFMCSNIDAEKTVWYKRVERRTYDNDGLVAIYEWEVINES